MADIKMMALLNGSHKLKSVFAAAVSNMMVAIAEISGDPDVANNPDIRENVVDVMSSLLSSDGIDRTCWPFVKEGLFYDAYLKSRKEAGTLTRFDLLRPGLIEANFSDLSSYFDHYQRAFEDRKRAEKAGATSAKTCTKCNRSKPAASFKRGSVCNTCRSKLYRARLLEREAESVDSASQGDQSGDES